MIFKKFPKSVPTMVEQQKENLISKTYKTPVSSFWEYTIFKNKNIGTNSIGKFFSEKHGQIN